ncbi:GRF-interacting factor 2 [Datura stramonium]|uniref:GRF-interacting factor 2 n=1 Tax=Datura stramonium TaxID=4076 RepID=A0ABS8WVV9_DATST|nr:GRF-interacting factor 2 [Datura stramonium]
MPINSQGERPTISLDTYSGQILDIRTLLETQKLPCDWASGNCTRPLLNIRLTLRIVNLHIAKHEMNRLLYTGYPLFYGDIGPRIIDEWSPPSYVYDNYIERINTYLAEVVLRPPQYLDENKTLILAILDHQNLGKLAECAQYQARLQKNLMYLAAIADAQPQSPAIPTQMAVLILQLQQGGFYMQHPQAAAMTPTTGYVYFKDAAASLTTRCNCRISSSISNYRDSNRYSSANRYATWIANSGMHSTLGSANNNGNQLTTSSSGDARGGNKQDNSEAEPSGADGQASW